MGVSRAVEGERLRQARETELARSIQEIDAVAGDVDAVYAGIETLMRAVLTLSGYHQHDRHWRKRRKAVTNGDKQ